MTRVLIVHNAYQQPGGEDAVVADEAELLRAHGVDVHLHRVDNDGIRGWRRKAQTLLQTVYNPAARRRLAAELRRLRPDVVHCHNLFPRLSPSVLDACLDEGVPTVVTLHNFRLLCPTATLHHRGRTEERSLRGGSWWAARERVYHGSFVGSLAVCALVDLHKARGTWRDRVNRFVALSEFARETFVAGGLPAERIAVKPNAVEAAPRSERPRAGALFVGRLTEDKGVRVLIKAWAGMDDPLTVVGDGPLYEWAKAHAPPNVTLTGRLPRSEARGLMERSALLILPSLWHEMLPVTLLEAYACGLPVAASDTASLRRLVLQPDGAAGFLVRPGDAAHLAAEVRRALADPARLAQLGATARSLHARRYSPEANYLRLCEIYREAIAEGPRRRAARGRRSPGVAARARVGTAAP